MGLVDEEINLGKIDKTLDKNVYDQFDNLYGNIQDQFRDQAIEVNGKADVILATRAPLATDLRQRGTIWIRTDTNQAWLCTSIASPSSVTWGVLI